MLLMSCRAATPHCLAVNDCYIGLLSLVLRLLMMSCRAASSQCLAMMAFEAAFAVRDFQIRYLDVFN